MPVLGKHLREKKYFDAKTWAWVFTAAFMAKAKKGQRQFKCPLADAGPKRSKSTRQNTTQSQRRQRRPHPLYRGWTWTTVGEAREAYVSHVPSTTSV